MPRDGVCQMPCLLRQVHLVDLRSDLAWQFGQPAAVNRPTAGDPEQLVIDGALQVVAQLLQLALVDLQGDGQVDQGVDVTVELFYQVDAGADHLLQRRAQTVTLRRGDF